MKNLNMDILVYDLQQFINFFLTIILKYSIIYLLKLRISRKKVIMIIIMTEKDYDEWLDSYEYEYDNFYFYEWCALTD